MTLHPPLFVGVDGGGSGSRARIRDGAGRCLAEATGGPANFYLDFGGALHNVRRLIEEAARRAGVSPGVLQAGLGLAGLVTSVDPGEISAIRLGVASAVADVDAYTACLGAFGGGDGGIVIAGTGSIAFGVTNGVRHMAGGWGMLLGDRGSGAWLGLEAVRHAAEVMDGFAAETELGRRVRSLLGETMFAISAWSERAAARDYAALAPMVFETAAAGDDTARRLCAEGAAAIARLIGSLLKHGIERVALLGGLAPRYHPLLGADLRHSLVPPVADALDGAILLAGGTIASPPSPP